MAGDSQAEARIGLYRAETVISNASLFGKPLPALAWSDTFLVVLLVSLFIGALIFVSIAGYARKETLIGDLEPTQGVARVIALKAGVVATIEVREGQAIEAGDPIASLNTETALDGGARLGHLLLAASERESAALQRRRAAQRLSIDRQIDSVRARRSTMQNDRVHLLDELALQNARVESKTASLKAADSLRERQYISELTYRQRQEDLFAAKQAASQLTRQITADEYGVQDLTATEARLNQERADAEAQLDGASEQLSAQRAAYSSDQGLVVLASKSGRVASLNAKPGSSLVPGALVATILPQGGQLQARLWARSRAMGFIKVGDPVKIMYDAFPYQRFGTYPGTVIAVDPTPTLPTDLPYPIETQEPLYRVTVRLRDQSVEAFQQKWSLPAGARLSADVVLEKRSLLSWLLEPILATQKRAQ